MWFVEVKIRAVQDVKLVNVTLPRNQGYKKYPYFCTVLIKRVSFSYLAVLQHYMVISPVLSSLLGSWTMIQDPRPSIFAGFRVEAGDELMPADRVLQHGDWLFLVLPATVILVTMARLSHSRRLNALFQAVFY